MIESSTNSIIAGFMDKPLSGRRATLDRIRLLARCLNWFEDRFELAFNPFKAMLNCGESLVFQHRPITQRL
jgi:hypothetical protein